MTIFEVAYHLKTPVYRIENEMPYTEFLEWVAYFEERPVGWRDDDRTMKLLQVQGVKAEPHQVFTSLRPIYTKAEEASHLASLKGSRIFQLMSSASGGQIIGG